MLTFPFLISLNYSSKTPSLSFFLPLSSHPIYLTHYLSNCISVCQSSFFFSLYIIYYSTYLLPTLFTFIPPSLTNAKHASYSLSLIMISFSLYLSTFYCITSSPQPASLLCIDSYSSSLYVLEQFYHFSITFYSLFHSTISHHYFNP